MNRDFSQLFYEDKQPFKLIKWKVKSGSRISNGNFILSYEFIDAESNPIKKLKSTKNGNVEELVAKEGDIVNPGDVLLIFKSGCSHQTFFKDMCAECGAMLKDLNINTSQHLSKSVSMLHSVPELRVNKQVAEKISKEDKNRLIENQKLVLLVDLDQTLIHTTNEQVQPNIKDVFTFQLYTANSPRYHTRIRPHTADFLEKMSKKFELHICTFGARQYAHRIAEFLDPSKKYFSHRILSRDECFDPCSKTANLKDLFPSGDSMVCIIDDREDVWNYSKNLIPVKPYVYFETTGDINAPPTAANLKKRKKSFSDTGSGNNDSKRPRSENTSIELVQNPNADLNNSSENQGNRNHTIGQKNNSKETTKISSHNSEAELKVEKKNLESDLVSPLKNDEIDEKSISANSEKSKEKNCIEKSNLIANSNPDEMKAEATSNQTESNTNSEALNKQELSSKNKIHNEIVSSDGLPEPIANLKIDQSPQAESSIEKDTKEIITPTDMSIDEKDLKGIITPTESSNNEKDSKEIITTTEISNDEKDSKAIITTTEISNDEKDSKEIITTSEMSNDEKDSKEMITPTESSNVAKDSKEIITTTEMSNDEKDSKEMSTDEKAASEETLPIEKVNIENKLISERSSQFIDYHKKEDSDDFLLYLEDILTKIHEAYFEEYNKIMVSSNKKDSIPDLKEIIPNLRNKVLKGVTIVFSGVIPTNFPPERSKIWYLAKSLGAEINSEISDCTTHLIASKWGTVKVNKASASKKIHIVTPHWLICCGERWEKVEEALFLFKKNTIYIPNKMYGNLPEEFYRKNKALFESSSFKTKEEMPKEDFLSNINPLHFFSQTELHEMDEEVREEVPTDDSDSSSDDDVEFAMHNEAEALNKMILGSDISLNSSEDDDSLTSDECPRGWKKSRDFVEEQIDYNSASESEEDM